MLHLPSCAAAASAGLCPATLRLAVLCLLHYAKMGYAILSKDTMLQCGAIHPPHHNAIAGAATTAECRRPHGSSADGHMAMMANLG